MTTNNKRKTVTRFAMTTTKRLVLLILACTLGSSVYLASCGGSLLTDSSQIVFPDSNVSYRNHVQPLFDLTCTFAGCHGNSNPAAGISFTSYFGFINRTGLVIIGKAEQSLLAQILDPRFPVSRLHPPSFQTRITQNQIDGVRTWIQEGARLN
jgi:hypothetical protein